MSRPRLSRNRTLPPNLTYDRTNRHFKYRRVDNGKFFCMGNNRDKAVSAAKQLNSMLLKDHDLIARVLETNPQFEKFIVEQFEGKILPDRGLAKKTLSNYKNQLIQIKKALGGKPIDEIRVKDIAEFIGPFPPRQSNSYRGLLLDIFKHAIAAGLIDSNPATSTISRKVIKTRRRLSLGEYRAIYACAEPWLQNAMNLALLTTQRREEIINMKFEDIRDNYLHVIQNKTKKHSGSAYIKIKLGQSLLEILERCHDGIDSPFIIHRLPKRTHQYTYNRHVTKITADYLSKSFARARHKSQLFTEYSTNELPTFHEIRSLAIKLYEDAGFDAQNLAGHADRAMTERYKAGHEIEWIDAEASLDLQFIIHEPV